MSITLKISAAAVAMGGLLAGCATPAYNYRAEATDVSAPPIGATTTATVGDVMLRQGRYQEIDAISLSETVKVGTIGTYSFSPGHYVKKGQNSQGEFYNSSTLPGSGQVQTGAITDPFQSLLLEPNGTSLCGVSVFGAKVCKGGVAVRKIRVPDLTPDSFQQTLIYSGKVGNKINIGYREFSGSLARPAFNNDVEYDLSDSNVIGYKGAQLEVLEATNQHIKYIVRRNFNAAQQ